MSEDITEMFYKESTPDWAKILDQGDFPHNYAITFSALVSTTFSLMMPWVLSSYLVDKLSNAILPKEIAEFINNEYMPDLHEAIKDV